jgi:hypothetical protein
MTQHIVGPTHYHIHAGLPGCMPNYAATASTKLEAQQDVANYASGWRDNGLATVGSAYRDGRVDCPDTDEYVEHGPACTCDAVWKCGQCGTHVDSCDDRCWCCGARLGRY